MIDLYAISEELAKLRAENAELKRDAARIYDAGWIAAAQWAGEDHLLSDMGSDAYIDERKAAIDAAMKEQA